MKKIMVLLEPSMGLLLNLHLRNPKEMKNIIDVGYMDTLQRNVWHHNLLKKTMLCNKPS